MARILHMSAAADVIAPLKYDAEAQSKVVLSESSGIEWYRVTSSDGYIIDEAIHE